MNDAERITVLSKGEKPDKVPFFPFGGNGFAISSNNKPPCDGIQRFPNYPEILPGNGFAIRMALCTLSCVCLHGSLGNGW